MITSNTIISKFYTSLQGQERPKKGQKRPKIVGRVFLKEKKSVFHSMLDFLIMEAISNKLVYN